MLSITVPSTIIKTLAPIILKGDVPTFRISAGFNRSGDELNFIANARVLTEHVLSPEPVIMIIDSNRYDQPIEKILIALNNQGIRSEDLVALIGLDY